MSNLEDAVLVEAAVAALTPSDGAAPAPPSAPSASKAPAPFCENCGASVPARYCGVCGQRLEPPIHSLGHFLKVATEDLTHADSRLWRTLWALLMKPGFLTREFLHGRRARYLPPVRLYLVLSVVFFIWLAAKPHEQVVGVSTSDGHVSNMHIVDLEAEGIQSPTAGTKSKETPEQERALRCSRMDYQGPWKARVAPLLKRGCERTAADNGRALIESFMHNLPRAMFVFLPLMAAVMMLLYWHPRHYYVEHLLFLVHNHAFAFVILMLAGVLGTLLPSVSGLIGWATTLYVAWYLYRATRVMYGQGRARTLSKLAFMSFVYLVAGSFMLAITSLYAFFTQAT
jgi:hypothetical protein